MGERGRIKEVIKAYKDARKEEKKNKVLIEEDERKWEKGERKRMN